MGVGPPDGKVGLEDESGPRECSLTDMRVSAGWMRELGEAGFVD